MEHDGRPSADCFGIRRKSGDKLMWEHADSNAKACVSMCSTVSWEIHGHYGNLKCIVWNLLGSI